ncbi:MAG TPA: NADH-quinone oxidoreductase subunit J [Tepidisphaeraceae bacterium]|jgi:NADH-quinone oxidoreductase subunit J
MSQVPLQPFLLLVLCVIAAFGTILALPDRQEPAVRKIGGVILFVAGLILMAMLVRWLAGPAGDERGGMGPYFWLFSAIALISAVRVITHTRPVYSALYFVLSVMASAGLFILLSAEFMAAALVLIYAGAILVTYVFVIMLATQTGASEKESTLPETDVVSREPVVASAIGFTLAGVLLYVIFDRAPVMNAVNAGIPAGGFTRALGVYLFQSQILSLEVAGLILTLAMVGAIVIAGRRIAGKPGHEPMHAATPATPISDDPNSIPVIGVDNPRLKAYPET